MSSNQNSKPQSSASDVWRKWIDENGSRLLLFARGQTRSQEDAQDVLQDAIVKLVGKVRSGEFVGGEESWMPYVYTSIRRLAIDLSRKDDRRKKREDNVTADAELIKDTGNHPWFDSISGDDETSQQLQEAIKKLPQKFSEVIVMKIWGDQTFAQIGESLEISQNTAASRYRYGLEALKSELANARRKGDLAI